MPRAGQCFTGNLSDSHATSFSSRDKAPSPAHDLHRPWSLLSGQQLSPDVRDPVKPES